MRVVWVALLLGHGAVGACVVESSLGKRSTSDTGVVDGSESESEAGDAQASGDEDGTGSGDGAPVPDWGLNYCDPHEEDTACRACQRDQCCAALDECVAHPPCQCLVECLSPPDEHSLAACEEFCEGGDNGVHEGLMGCTADHCGAHCPTG